MGDFQACGMESQPWGHRLVVSLGQIGEPESEVSPFPCLAYQLLLGIRNGWDNDADEGQPPSEKKLHYHVFYSLSFMST